MLTYIIQDGILIWNPWLRSSHEDRSLHRHDERPVGHSFEASAQVFDQRGNPGRFSGAGEPLGIAASYRCVHPEPARLAQRRTVRPQGSARRAQTRARALRRSKARLEFMTRPEL